MSKIGFVYILTNEYMPGVYKVGCTERSPHERAAELSAPTGVPAPFEVLCYVECHDFQAIERKVHAWLSDFRVSNGREFFCDRLELAVRLLYWLPTRLSFTSPFPADDQVELALEHVFLREIPNSIFQGMERTRNPFVRNTTLPPEPGPEQDASVVAVVAAATSAASVAQEAESAPGGSL